MPPPAAAPKTPLAAYLDELKKQMAPEFQGLGELFVSFTEKPNKNDVARALFRVKKISAVLEEAQRQMIARGMIPTGD